MTAKFFEFNEYMTAVFKVQKCLRPFKHCTAPSTLLELRSFCETNHIGLKVGLGNIEILNVESGPKALIDFQVINMKVVPRPIIFSNESNKLHDTIEIDRSYYTGSCMSALVVGAKLVRVKDFSGTTHIAIDNLKDAVSITQRIGCFDDLIKSGSLFASIKCFMREHLPVFQIPYNIAIESERAPWLFAAASPEASLHRNTVTWDVKRAYRSALQSITLAQFCCLDEIEKCEKHIRTKTVLQPGQYYVANVTAREGASIVWHPLSDFVAGGWVYHELLSYLSATVDFDVLWAQKASRSFSPLVFKNILDRVDTELTPDQAKLFVNSWIGLQRTKDGGRQAQYAFITKCKHEAELYASLTPSYTLLQNLEWDGPAHGDGPDTDRVPLTDGAPHLVRADGGPFICVQTTETKTQVTTRHIYDQIIEGSWMLVHQMLTEMLKVHPNAKLVSIKTDAVTLGIDGEVTGPSPNSNYRLENRPTIPQGVVRPTPSPPGGTAIMNESPLPIIDIDIDCSIPSPMVSMCIIGIAGTAKSSFLKRVLSVHPQSPVIAPTNRAASAFVNGRTIHNFFCIKDITTGETTVSSGLLAHIAAKHKIILVDEFFMCDYWMLHAFMTLTRLGTVIVGAGDEYQLPSISLLPGHIFDSHSSVMRIIFRKILRLSKVLRSEGAPAAILAECVRSHTINLLNAREAPLDLTASRHLTYTNIASDNLNALVLQSKIRLYRKILWCSGKDIGIATCMREVPKGSVMFTRNSPLRLQTSNVYGTRNTSFVLKSFYKTNGFYYARLQYDHQGPGIEHSFKLCTEFFQTTTLTYALTIHKAQGITINEHYQIHEISKICKKSIAARLIYVAFTRASRDMSFSLCMNCSC